MTRLRQVGRRFVQLAAFDTFRGLANLRWLIVPPAMLVTGWLEADYVAFGHVSGRTLPANFWDAPLSMMTGAAAAVFVFALGFILVSGDLYVRDRTTGTAVMTLLRSPSLLVWWTAKIAALGSLALIYSLIGFVAALAASATRLPLGLGLSPAGRVPWAAKDAIYPRIDGLPVPVLLLLVVLYTAAALWSVGAVVLLVSVLVPRFIVPLAFGFVWVIGLSWLAVPIYFRPGVGRLDPMYHVSYAVHFSTESFTATPWWESFAVIAGVVAIVLVAGAWKLRRSDM